ncbi:hypothetical protein [Corynebacterium lowii]|uniref:Uncharacterized protein n=1 Tax=Corynebacterium lowii TaxID=1544413 RepID=A0A0Q0U405_9CORY|nr:hypothetical protein [Corynebacterium lowii]KQB86695.1 hypothetical protein Clow_00903 [Corynebacterium lowii]MDP9851381.1 hypothetical protein [Corynebacterium lowii]
MKIMPYGSLLRAEKNSKTNERLLSVAPLNDNDWAIAVRGAQRYEECAKYFFGVDIDLGLWLGDKYIMYGTQDSFEVGGMYRGVRRWNIKPSGWRDVSLTDRDKEAGSFLTQASSFGIAWAYIMRSFVWELFFRTDAWRSSGRVSFFKDERSGQVDSILVGKGDESLNYDAIWWNKEIDPDWKMGEDYPFTGEGYVHFLKADRSYWYKDVFERQMDLSWSLGMDIEEWVDILFMKGMEL